MYNFSDPILFNQEATFPCHCSATNVAPTQKRRPLHSLKSWPHFYISTCLGKDKAIPVQAVEALRVAVRLWALWAGRFLPPGKFLVLIFVRGWVEPRAIVLLEGLGKLKRSTWSGTRTGDLPACNIVLQPTTLPRAPKNLGENKNIGHGSRQDSKPRMTMLASFSRNLTHRPTPCHL
jgi:hypothetical protein